MFCTAAVKFYKAKKEGGGAHGRAEHLEMRTQDCHQEYQCDGETCSALCCNSTPLPSKRHMCNVTTTTDSRGGGGRTIAAAIHFTSNRPSTEKGHCVIDVPLRPQWLAEGEGRGQVIAHPARADVCSCGIIAGGRCRTGAPICFYVLHATQSIMAFVSVESLPKDATWRVGVARLLSKRLAVVPHIRYPDWAARGAPYRPVLDAPHVLRLSHAPGLTAV